MVIGVLLMKVLVVISSLRVAVFSLILFASRACLRWACVLVRVRGYVRVSTAIKTSSGAFLTWLRRHTRVENVCEGACR